MASPFANRNKNTAPASKANAGAPGKEGGSGLFGGVGSSRFAGRDPFFPPEAEFLIEVAEVQCYESKNPKHKNAVFFKIRGRVLATAFDAQDPPSGMLRPGQYGTQLINLAHGEPALGDIKNFATAAYRAVASNNGADPDEEVHPDTFGDAEIDALYDADQPCAGLILGLKTTGKKTQSDGDFTQHYWEDGNTFAFSLPEQARLEAKGPNLKTPSRPEAPAAE